MRKSRRRKNAAPAIAIAATLLSSIGAARVAAHDGPHPQIQLLTEDIRRAPFRAQPYLKRGQQYMVIGHFDLALADFDAAAGFGGAIADAADTSAAETLQCLGRDDDAELRVNGVIGRAPTAANAWLVRGRLLAAAGRHLEAARSFHVGLGLSDQRRPDDVLQCVRAYRAAGATDAGLELLNTELKAVGAVVALEREALQFERELGRYDDALSRIRRLAATARRPERWLLLRGDVLVEADRCGDARIAYEAALHAIDQLPIRHRSTVTTQRMVAQATRGLTLADSGNH